MIYGFRMGDDELYYENAKNLYKKNGKKDLTVLNKIILDLNTNHSKD